LRLSSGDGNFGGEQDIYEFERDTEHKGICGNTDELEMKYQPKTG